MKMKEKQISSVRRKKITLEGTFEGISKQLNQLLKFGVLSDWKVDYGMLTSEVVRRFVKDRNNESISKLLQYLGEHWYCSFVASEDKQLSFPLEEIEKKMIGYVSLPIPFKEEPTLRYRCDEECGRYLGCGRRYLGVEIIYDHSPNFRISVPSESNACLTQYNGGSNTHRLIKDLGGKLVVPDDDYISTDEILTKRNIIRASPFIPESHSLWFYKIPEEVVRMEKWRPIFDTGC